MPGAKDLPHAAFAERFEEQIRPDAEFAGRAGAEFVQLKRCDNFGAEKLSSRVRIRRERGRRVRQQTNRGGIRQ
jgi:hypothetical protein